MKNLNYITKHIGFIVETPEYEGDSIVNCIGDIIFAIIGWSLANIILNKN